MSTGRLARIDKMLQQYVDSGWVAEKQSRLVRVSTEDRNRHLVTANYQMVNYPLSGGTYYSGGAGLSSIVKDYAIFLQMLLNKGQYNGKRLLSRRTVDLITANQIGDLNLGSNKSGFGFAITTRHGEIQDKFRALVYQALAD